MMYRNQWLFSLGVSVCMQSWGPLYGAADEVGQMIFSGHLRYIFPRYDNVSDEHELFCYGHGPIFMYFAQLSRLKWTACSLMYRRPQWSSG